MITNQLLYQLSYSGTRCCYNEFLLRCKPLFVPKANKGFRSTNPKNT